MFDFAPSSALHQVRPWRSGSALHQVRPCTSFGLAPGSALHQVRPSTRLGLAPSSALHQVRPWRPGSALHQVRPCARFGLASGSALASRFGLGVQVRLCTRFGLGVQVSTLADQVHFGRSSHFSRSSPLGSGQLGRPISRTVLVMQDCPIGSTLRQVYFSIGIRLTLCMYMHRQTLIYIGPHI